MASYINLFTIQIIFQYIRLFFMDDYL